MYSFSLAIVAIWFRREENLIKGNSVFGSIVWDLHDDDWPSANTWVGNEYGSASWE